MEKMIAEVTITKRNIAKNFDYLIPKGMEVHLGDYVEIPFGKGNHTINGWVVGIKEKSEFSSLKPIKENFGKIIRDDLWKLGEEMAAFYQIPLGMVLPLLSPLGKDIHAEEEFLKKVIVLKDQIGEETINELPEAQKKIILQLKKGFLGSKTALSKEAKTSLSPIKTLLKKGLIQETLVLKYQSPYKEIQLHQEKLTLTSEQEKVWLQIRPQLKQKSEFLLYGVTGSGKTYIYLKAIDEILQQKKEAIFLVPEISLTPQLVRLLKQRYGNLVAVFHSKLTHKQRLSEWLRMLKGEAKLCVGARSAIFAPFSNLGLIIIDEEGESSYKQTESPRYEIKDVAHMRQKISSTPLLIIWGSATPSLETYFSYYQKDIAGSTLQKRYNNVSLPQFTVVDMKREGKTGNRSIFSRTLREKIEERLARKEQVILFHNRRAFSTYVFCRNCGWEERCPECSVTLKYYKKSSYLRCNYCDYQKNMPVICPQCGSRHIRHYGLGTEKVEEKIKKLFPQARILRVDSDNINTLSKHEEVFSKIKKQQIDIIVGTQMISRGLHFPNITLVGILLYDTLLSLPDFNASYRAFSLLTQVGGRSGRGEKKGEVIIQTFHPHHYTIKAAVKNDYTLFFEKEIQQRKKLFYPPFSKLINIVFVSKNEKNLAFFCEKSASILKNQLQNKFPKEIKILGPAPAVLEKLQGNYRWQILCKISPEIFSSSIIASIYKIIQNLNIPSSISFYLDINPYNLF